jgi:hypothetical protein
MPEAAETLANRIGATVDFSLENPPAFKKQQSLSLPLKERPPRNIVEKSRVARANCDDAASD